MSLILEKCVEFNEKRKICIAAENSKTYRLENNSGYLVRKVKIDGCVAQGAGERRCDYLMNIDNDGFKSAFFIELKGGALVDALEQIHETIGYLKKEFKGYSLNARIVGSRDVPNFKSQPAYLKLAREVKSTKGTIERATNKIYTEKI